MSCMVVRGTLSGSQGQVLVSKVLECARTGVQAVVINLEECEAITTDLFSAFTMLRKELPESRYLGLEIELNQANLNEPGLARRVLEAVPSALG